MNLDPKPLVDEPEPTPVDLPPVDTTTPPVQLTDDLVNRLNTMTSQQVTPEMIREILAAQTLAHSGCPLGTVRRSDIGVVAVKVCRNGVPMWAVIHLDGGFSYDTEPTLPWTKIADALAGP